MKRKGPRRKHVVPRVLVRERKLGKHQAWGLAHKHGVIEIDPRLKGLARLEILVHEFLHLLDWQMPENEVESRGKRLAEFLHKNRVRVIEEGDTLLP